MSLSQCNCLAKAASSGKLHWIAKSFNYWLSEWHWHIYPVADKLAAQPSISLTMRDRVKHLKTMKDNRIEKWKELYYIFCFSIHLHICLNNWQTAYNIEYLQIIIMQMTELLCKLKHFVIANFSISLFQSVNDTCYFSMPNLSFKLKTIFLNIR